MSPMIVREERVPSFREAQGCMGEDPGRERWKDRLARRMVFGSPVGKADMSIQDERHSYEKCQYEEFKLRVKKMDELRAEKGERSN